MRVSNSNTRVCFSSLRVRVPSCKNAFLRPSTCGESRRNHSAPSYACAMAASARNRTSCSSRAINRVPCFLQMHLGHHVGYTKSVSSLAYDASEALGIVDERRKTPHKRHSIRVHHLRFLRRAIPFRRVPPKGRPTACSRFALRDVVTIPVLRISTDVRSKCVQKSGYQTCQQLSFKSSHLSAVQHLQQAIRLLALSTTSPEDVQ